MAFLTLVFTDVVDSSAIKRDPSFGRDNMERDEAYLRTVQTPHFTLVRTSCRKHNGIEKNNAGDSFLLGFENPEDAVRCAIDIQQQLSSNPIKTPSGPLRLRIGIHSGFPKEFEKSWHGTAVDVASRIESAAHPDQILISSTTYEIVSDMSDVKFQPRGEHTLKGVGNRVLWEVDWSGRGPFIPGTGTKQQTVQEDRSSWPDVILECQWPTV